MTDVLLLLPCLLGAHLCVADQRTEMHTFSRHGHFGNCNCLINNQAVCTSEHFLLRKLKV